MFGGPHHTNPQFELAESSFAITPDDLQRVIPFRLRIRFREVALKIGQSQYWKHSRQTSKQRFVFQKVAIMADPRQPCSVSDPEKQHNVF